MNTESFDSVTRFLSENHRAPVVLRKRSVNGTGDGMPLRGPLVAVSPHLAGRVVAVCFQSVHEENPLFINRSAVLRPDNERPYHPEGGHRWWPLPEGQRDWSLYFPAGTAEYSMSNWKVPASFDKASFVVEEVNQDSTTLRTFICMTNVRGHRFEVMVRVSYRLIDVPEGASAEGMAHVGYEQHISFTNLGKTSWDEKNGMISPWSLAMITSGDNCWIFLPVKHGSVEGIVDFQMSGDGASSSVEKGRLLKRESYALFRADGKYRGKLGIPPSLSTGCIGAIDYDRRLIVVMKTSIPAGARYIDNTWNAAGRYGGTAMDCYNDSGAIADSEGRSMFELECVSPVHTVLPGECIEYHIDTHFVTLEDDTGPELLNECAYTLTGCDLRKETIVTGCMHT